MGIEPDIIFVLGYFTNIRELQSRTGADPSCEVGTEALAKLTLPHSQSPV